MPYKDRNKRLEYNKNYSRNHKRSLEQKKEKLIRDAQSRRVRRANRTLEQVEAERLYSARAYERNKEKLREYANAPENRAKAALRARKHKLGKSGWTLESFEKSWELQGGRCAICSVNLTRGSCCNNDPNSGCADHKHVDPPQPRGLLCHKHNSALGFFGDDPALLRKAIEYVEFYDSLGENK